ncbi:MAG: polymerase subunit sigma [Chitinophagaceae bacterium]|nr:polymerase subunit sigma [Chitinophagaceae bacterium]
MKESEIIPHLFRTEYRNIIAVLCKRFGIEHIEIAEDIVSETFLIASETWGQKGLPPHPIAWLYTVAKNKTKDFLKHNHLFTQKIVPEIKYATLEGENAELDLSTKNIEDSQLQMIFAICHPSIPIEAQIGLALNILCGFGAEEIADAFLTNKETIYKRLSRAKDTLRIKQIRIELPSAAAIDERLQTVLTTLYLLFNEGYYSTSQNKTLRKDLCLEAMRLTYLLTNCEQTNTPSVNALLSLICFHSSRFEARTDDKGEIILYEDQDISLWSKELIEKGEHYLNLSSKGQQLSRYHLEAAIGFWHTKKEDLVEKWENILQLYNRLLQLEYSPIAALNRTYALSKANGIQEAIVEAEKLQLTHLHLYHSLLANLYEEQNTEKALMHLRQALSLAKTSADKNMLGKKLQKLEQRGNS